MFLLFDIRCGQCGNRFKAEANPLAPDAGGTDYHYRCPRCSSTGITTAGVADMRNESTPWAVRATLAEAVSPAADQSEE